MSALPESTPSVSPSLIAALLLVARQYQEDLGLPYPNARSIFETTKAARSRAYELTERIKSHLPELVGPVGRPKKPATPVAAPDASLTRKVLEFVIAHPGCVSGDDTRRRFYTDLFRNQIIELRESHPEMELGAFAQAVTVPKGTIEDWLRAGRRPTETSTEPDTTSETKSVHIQSVLSAYRSWCGAFTDFCDHVRRHLRIPLGDASVANILFLHSERTPRRRSGRAPDEEATRKSFETFFPGAQWVGDGMQVEVRINEESFTFNLELMVDAASDAHVGASIRDEEDGAAVAEAFDDGVNTTGNAPIAALLDNRSSNHTEEVDDALEGTLRIRATLGRPQNKAHAEGSFGLFSQYVPPLEFQVESLRDLAKQILQLQVQTLGRVLNRRPRQDRQGKSRVDIYRMAAPNDEEIADARRALEERMKKQEQALSNRLAKADPLTLFMLEQAFDRLELLDPDEHVRSVIARYDRDTIIDAIAIFEGKKNAGTLPETADARYLLGIVKNLAHTHEADAITSALIRQRLEARDKLLADLEQQRVTIMNSCSEPGPLLRALLDQALSANRMVDRFFWLDTAASEVANQPREQQEQLYRSLARRIHATFSLSTRERSSLERRLARLVWPVT